MREAAFLRQNAERWKEFESLLKNERTGDPDQLAELFVRVTDDLGYARTFYPESKSTVYLNALAQKVHQAIYRNKREKKGRLLSFWVNDVPQAIYDARREILYAAIIFVVAITIGALSAANDTSFVRLILGDGYVNMTLDNIEKGNPLAVYGRMESEGMFAVITFNNIRVAFIAFAMGAFFSVGAAWIIFQNGVMVGAFFYLFHSKGLLLTSLLGVYIHGTLELTAIVIAGGAGFVMGNSLIFPRTYSRTESFKRGARRGAKIVLGLVPVFMIAGFLESFVTRYNAVSAVLNSVIILASVSLLVWYFGILPYRMHRHGNLETD